MDLGNGLEFVTALSMEDIKDDRFTHISLDPSFRATPKTVKKVKIDERFQSLFTDKRFQVKYSIDKRGRPVDQSSHENFRKYYELSTDDDSSEEDDNEEKETKNETRSVTSFQNQATINNKLIPSETSTKMTKSSKTNNWTVTPSNELYQKNSSNTELTGSNKSITTIHREANLKKSKNINVDLERNKIEIACMTDDIKTKLRDPNIDYARGVGTLMSDTSSGEGSSEDYEVNLETAVTLLLHYLDCGDAELDEEEVEHEWGEVDRHAETTEEATNRLAVLHMDWDRIRAIDLMVLFNSFLPPEGVISSITIYPSQFGLERMKEEEEKGPKELVNMRAEEKTNCDEESKDGKKNHMERLRQYQLNRLKYYYAIIKFDCVETANKVYVECDGLEYESSATKLDLRFVPEEEFFDQEPHEVCTAMPDPTKYEPRLFTNTALQQGKVELTWDETDPERQEFTKKMQRNADNIDTADLEVYLASSSGDEGEDKDKKIIDIHVENDLEDIKEEDKIAKYKSLLASLEEEEEKKKTRDVDLEITWGIGLKEKAEKSIKEKLSMPQTPFEEILEKRRQRKRLKREDKMKQNKEENDSDNLHYDDDIPSDVDMNDPYFKGELPGPKMRKKKKIVNNGGSGETDQKKAELELLVLDENDSEKQKSHFNIKRIQDQEKEEKRKKRRKQLKKKPQEILVEKDDFQVDVEDERFSALFTSHHFNIDPAEPYFRKTKAMEAIIFEKLKRRKQEYQCEPLSIKSEKTVPELSLLVKSVKNKTKHKS